MICPECNGMGETIYYIETDRNENTVTVAQRKGICRTCNGSGKKPMTNADRIRSMTDRELADFFYGIRECSVCAYNYEDRCVRCSDGIFKWLQKPAETPKEDA